MPDRGFFRIEYYIPDGNGPLYQERSYIRRRNLENSSQRIQEIGIGSLNEFQSEEVDQEGWVRCLFDSGASTTAIPADAHYGATSKAEKKCSSFVQMEM